MRKPEDKLGMFIPGDLIDGHHHQTTQLVSGNPVTQKRIARACFDSVFADLKPDAIFIIRGTEVHVGGSACNEEEIADDWKREGLPVQTDEHTASWWHFVGDFEGVRVDVAHHGRMGGRSWTKPNQALMHAADIYMKHSRRKLRHPDLVLRAHSHTSADSHDAHPVRYIAMPAWMFKSSHAHKVVPNEFPDIGGVIATCENGELDAKLIVYPLDPPKVWTAA